MTAIPPDYLDLERRLNAALSVLEGRTITPELIAEVSRGVAAGAEEWLWELGPWAPDRYLPWMEWVAGGMQGDPPCDS